MQLLIFEFITQREIKLYIQLLFTGHFRFLISQSMEVFFVPKTIPRNRIIISSHKRNVESNWKGYRKHASAFKDFSENDWDIEIYHIAIYNQFNGNRMENILLQKCFTYSHMFDVTWILFNVFIYVLEAIKCFVSERV